MATEKKERVQTGVRIDAELWRRFRAECIMRRDSTRDVLENLLKEYLDKKKSEGQE